MLMLITMVYSFHLLATITIITSSGMGPLAQMDHYELGISENNDVICNIFAATTMTAVVMWKTESMFCGL